MQQNCEIEHAVWAIPLPNYVQRPIGLLSWTTGIRRMVLPLWVAHLVCLRASVQDTYPPVLVLPVICYLYFVWRILFYFALCRENVDYFVSLFVEEELYIMPGGGTQNQVYFDYI